MPKTTGNYEISQGSSTPRLRRSIAALTEKFKTLISDNGTINNIEEWGKRRLAYPIEDETEGHYVLIDFTSGVAFPAELDRIYKITDGVLRSMIIAK